MAISTMITQALLLLLHIAVADCFVNVAFVNQKPTATKNHAVLFSQRDDGAPMVSFFDENEDGGGEQTEQSEERHIPTTGISVSDEMDAAQRDQFVTEVVPVEGLPGVAQLVSNPVIQDAFEPVRYLVALSPPFTISQETESVVATEDSEQVTPSLIYENATFALVDVPPFSPQLVTRLKAFMGINHKLVAILITSSDVIHFDEALSQMYSMNRRADLLNKWKNVFPEAAIVAPRLDTPRDCHGIVSQKLDGNGPFGWNDEKSLFEEMGRPLRFQEWDHSIAERVFSGERNPEDAEANMMNAELLSDDDGDYTVQAIRAREDDRRILAVCTPGHSFGSMSYVFPETKVCVTGYTIPVEDNRAEENEGFSGAGPALDVRGYITTSQAGITRQMASARRLVTDYGDRFTNVLPCRGDPLMLDGNLEEDRKDILMGIIDQYDRIGQIYEQLGITSSSADINEFPP